MNQIKSLIPPTIITGGGSGKKYLIVDGVWFETELNMSDIEWIRSKPLIVKPLQPNVRTFEVLASSGKHNYVITLLNNVFSCDCPAFGFRRRCKHIEQVKSHINEQKST